MQRPTWDEYFMKMAYLAATRSNCTRRKVGAVIVKDRKIVSTGYNGPPKGSMHCDESGCLREQLNIPSGERHELCRGLHAEQNAIIQAAVFGTVISGSVIYVTTHPCVVCSKMLINAEVNEIIFAEGYPDELSELMLIESGLKTRQFDISQDFKNILFGENILLLREGED
jgi:dCMP deaminase